LYGRKMRPRQRYGPRCDKEPCRFKDQGKDDGECYRENKRSRNGETETDRAFIFCRRRRIPGRRTVVSAADTRLRRGQAGGAPAVQANFMNMPDREPELQCQSQQPKPHAEAAWYRGDAFDHSLKVFAGRFCSDAP
jgi:hypothetical protein